MAINNINLHSAKKRESWVDISKGISIIAVVLGHISIIIPSWKLLPLPELLFQLWHVPVFFLIGGFFIKDEKLFNPFLFIQGKLKSIYLLILYIYIPVLILHNFWISIGFYDLGIDYIGKHVTWWGVTDLLKNIIETILFAGREPLLGAMWFVYVLFIALCCLSLISSLIKKFVKNDKQYEYVRFIVLFVLAILSCTLTNLYNFTIPRANNTITAIWLIYIGMLMVQKLHIVFDNVYLALIGLIIGWHTATIVGGVSLNKNSYETVIILTISSCACLYFLCYISKKIEKTFAGKTLSMVGKDSFYIMGLHFFGFKICSLLLIAIGMNINLAELTAPAGDHVFLALLYLLFGVFAPLGFMWIFRKVKREVLLLIDKRVIYQRTKD